MNARLALALITTIGISIAGAAHAQSPQTQPLVQASNVVHLGVIHAPNGASLGAGPNGMAVDGNTWYFGCSYAGVAVLTLPPLGGTAQVTSPCATFPNIDQVHPTDTHVVTGGVLPWLGRVITSAYVYYDGSGLAVRSHWAGATVGTLSGPYQLGTDRAGMVAGYMGVIPPEWRTLLGGPALTGMCCIPIIGRSSFGPSVSVFDPAHLGTQATVPSKMLIGYPIEHQNLGAWDANPPNTYYGGTDQMGSVAFPAGTRSVLFTGRHGDQFCYGPGTGNPALVGTPGPGAYAYCYDPLDPYQGNHGPPYRPTMWAYDANDLLDVKAGTKKPWDIQPYAKWTLPGMPIDGATNLLRAGYYDPATRRLYVGSTDSMTVHVFEITNAVIPPQVEVCGDGIDNDGDGLIDEGCAEVCGDGIDNDGDGLIDEGCAEVCGDGIDNDGDGLIDEGCVEVCGDGIDNDGDGLTDEGCVEVCDGIDNDGDGVVDEGCSEVCDGIDNNRDGVTDEGCSLPWAKPSAPVTLEGTVTGTTVSFTWLAPLTGGAVTGYELEAGVAPGLVNYMVPVGLQTQASFPDIGTGRYYIRVRAMNANGSSPASNEVAVSVGCSAQPSQMTGISAISNQGLVTLTWTDPDGCSGTTYVVVVATTPGGAAVSTLTPTSPSTTTQLPAGTYYARIAAVADSGRSAVTEVAFTVRASGCAVPTFRSRLTSRVVGRQVEFSWSPLDPERARYDDAVAPVSYVLEAGSFRGAADIGSAPMNRGGSYSLAAPSGVYFVRVRPVNACGSGSPSADERVEIR